MHDFAAPLFVATENHFACRSLQHAGHRAIHGLADHLACIVDNDHRAVIQIGNALIEFLAFFKNEDLHGFAGQIDRLQRVSQFIDVEHFHAAQLSNLVQIEVIRHDLGFKFLGKLNELHVDFAHGRIVVLDKLDSDAGHLLNALKNVEPAPSTIPLQGISGVRNLLQLPKNKMRNNKHAVEKSSLADIGDTPINDDACVENLIDPLVRALTAKNTTECREVKEVALVRPHHQPHIGHQEKDKNGDER